MQRTDEQKLTKEPIKLKFGSTDYPIQIRNMNQSREWRTKLIETMSGILAQLPFGATPRPTPTAIGTVGGLTAALLVFPDKIAELIFAYAPDLPVETIQNEATDEQLEVAYGAIMAVAFPYLAQLTATIRAIAEVKPRSQ